MCVRARKKSTKSGGTTCFGNGFSLSPCKVSHCLLRALAAIGDLSPSKGDASVARTTTRTSSQGPASALRFNYCLFRLFRNRELAGNSSSASELHR